MIFKNVNQLIQQLHTAKPQAYVFNPGALTDREKLLKSTMDIGKAKIFNAGYARDICNTVDNLYKDKEAVEIIKSITDVSTLPFDELVYIVKLAPPKPVLGELITKISVPNTLIISVTKVNNDTVGVSFFIDVDESDKRLALPHAQQSSDKIIPHLEFKLHEVYFLHGTYGSSSMRPIAYLNRPTPITNGGLTGRVAEYYNEIIVMLLMLTMYYKAVPAVERKASGGKSTTLNKGSSNYVLDYSKPRVKYVDLPDKPKGSHARPREHVREPHIRRYKSGKVVEVGRMTINEGIGKRVDKQYKL